MKPEPAFITPKVLSWARERAHASHAKIAKKITKATKAETVAAWERGDVTPNFSQAQKLATALYVPLGYLFLPDPPEEVIPLPDFRTVGSGGIARPSANLIDFMNEALFRHGWYKEYLTDRGASQLDFVGKYAGDPAPDPMIIAKDIADTIGLTKSLRDDHDSWNGFFSELVRMVESNGITVMRNRVVAGNHRRAVRVDEFRGFAICDSIAPLICINSADAPAAQIFTLAHELAHIWVGSTGVSSIGIPIENGVISGLEKFCNATAAELLIPLAEVRSTWRSDHSIQQNMRTIRLRYKVSNLVALRRGLDAGYINAAEFDAAYKAEMKAISSNNRETTGGSPFITLVSRLGYTVTSSLVEAAKSGSLTYRDAAQMLNIRVATIGGLEKHLVKIKK